MSTLKFAYNRYSLLSAFQSSALGSIISPIIGMAILTPEIFESDLWKETWIAVGFFGWIITILFTLLIGVPFNEFLLKKKSNVRLVSLLSASTIPAIVVSPYLSEGISLSALIFGLLGSLCYFLIFNHNLKGEINE